MRNIKISEKTDAKIEQAESLWPWLIVAFVAFAWLCRNDVPMEAKASPPTEVNLLHSLGLI